MNKALLPRVPSQLIRLALADLRKVEADPKYRVSMGHWHSRCSDTCYVCLAGSVMAKTLSAPPVNVPLSAFPNDYQALLALNDFRMGHVDVACMRLGIERPESVPGGIYVPGYEEDPERFHSTMHYLAANLEAAGL